MLYLLEPASHALLLEGVAVPKCLRHRPCSAKRSRPLCLRLGHAVPQVSSAAPCLRLGHAVPQVKLAAPWVSGLATPCLRSAQPHHASGSATLYLRSARPCCASGSAMPCLRSAGPHRASGSAMPCPRSARPWRALHGITDMLYIPQRRSTSTLGCAPERLATPAPNTQLRSYVLGAGAQQGTRNSGGTC